MGYAIESGRLSPPLRQSGRVAGAGRLRGTTQVREEVRSVLLLQHAQDFLTASHCEANCLVECGIRSDRGARYEC